MACRCGLGTTNVHGLQAETTMGHTRARFFGPEDGRADIQFPLDTGVFRIDHDQAFQQTTNVRYQRPKNGAWFSFTWRYDSGEVAGAVTSLADTLSLTAAQQAAIGFFCGNQIAAPGTRSLRAAGSNYGATRLIIPRARDIQPRPESTTRRSPAPARSGDWDGQSVPQQRQGSHCSQVQRGEFDEQGSFIQLPVDFQRHALRVATDLSGGDKACVSSRASMGWI